MARLVLLNGCVNAGKSTVARILRERCANLAHIEVDALNTFIDWMPIEQAVPLNLDNAVAVARNFLAAGLDVLFTYPLSDGDYAYILERLGEGWDVRGVCLWCDPALNQRNRGTRELSEWERSRIAWMHENGVARPTFAEIVDNTAQSPEETAEQVIALTGLRRRDRPA